MIKKLKTTLLTVMSLSLFAVPLLTPVAVGAQQSQDQIEQGLCAGANLDATGGTCDTTSTEAQDTVNSILTLVINIFSLVVGVAAVIMIIVGGLRYIISGGDSGNVQSAKNTILYAIIGLVVVALAQFVVKFVLSKVAGATS